MLAPFLDLLKRLFIYRFFLLSLLSLCFIPFNHSALKASVGMHGLVLKHFPYPQAACVAVAVAVLPSVLQAGGGKLISFPQKG